MVGVEASGMWSEYVIKIDILRVRLFLSSEEDVVGCRFLPGGSLFSVIHLSHHLSHLPELTQLGYSP